MTRIINHEHKMPACGFISPKSINQNRSFSYSIYKEKHPKNTVIPAISDTYKDRMYTELDQRQECGINTRFHSIPAYLEALNHFDVKDFIRLGGESSVFELNSGDIIKFSCEEYSPYLAKYHAPEIQRGKIHLSRKYKATNISHFTNFDTDEIYYLIQKKGEIAKNTLHINKLWNTAKKENLNTEDFRCDQFAYFDTHEGKVIKCVDLGCITIPEYPMLRDLKVIEKISPKDACNPYGTLYRTLKKHFNNIFAGDSDKINEFVKSIEPRLKIGESIFKIMKIKF